MESQLDTITPATLTDDISRQRLVDGDERAFG
jgi:hypothetical protein